MRSVSEEYRKYVSGKSNARNFTAKATITLANNKVLEVTEKDIVVNGLSMEDAVSQSSEFQIGSAIINQLTLLLNNVEGEFDEYDFTDAIVVPYIGLKLSNTIEWIKLGYYTVDEPTVAKSIISLICLDNMHKFDTPFSDIKINYPVSASALLYSVCLHCGVSLASTVFTNSNFNIVRAPSEETTTCREMVAWIAQLSGNFARCNSNGVLELRWYNISAFETADNIDGGTFDKDNPYDTGDTVDGGIFANYNSGSSIDGGTFLQAKQYHHIYALSDATIATDDIIITGVQVKAMGTESDYGETVLYGEKGYVLSIDENPLITENTASIVATAIGQKIVGMLFRSLSVSALADLSIEAGDVAYVTDRKGNSYQAVITSLSYTIGMQENIRCEAETLNKKNSVKFSAVTKAIIEERKKTKQQISAYDQAVQQLTNLMANSFGVFKTEEKQEDGSFIYYMHDKPTLSASSTIWKMTADAFAVSTDGGKTWGAGFDSNGNAVVNVLNAVGINADWINTGSITSKNGTSRLDLENGTFNLGDDNLTWDGTKLIAKGHIETNSGKIGKFNITNSGLENDTFKLYDADGAPWMWMYDIDGKESTTMQTVGFAKLREYDTYRTQTTLKEELIMNKTDSDSNEDLHVVTISKNGVNSYTENINEDGYFTILTDYGTLSFYESYAVFQSYTGASINFDNGNVSIQSLNCSIALNDNDVYINSNRSNGGVVYVDGFDVAGSFRSIESDIYTIKQRIGLT